MNISKIRRGIYFISDTSVLPDELLVPVTAAALRGGVVLVQLRAKGRPDPEVASLGRLLLEVTRQFQVPLLINDLPHVARDIGADGAHVGAEDMSVRQARHLLGPQALIGATTSTPEAVRRAEAEGADYIALGAIFPSLTKPTAELMPLHTARELAACTRLPVCVIGGIDQGNIAQLADLAPDLVCVVSAIARAQDPEQAARQLTQAMAAWATNPRR